MPKFQEDTEKKLQKLEESVVAFEKIAKGCCEEKEDEGSDEKLEKLTDAFYQLASMLSDFRYTIAWLKDDLRYLESSFSAHKEGHLPPIKGAEKMQNALDALGIGEDYEIAKPVVYASDRRGGVTAEISFPKSK